MTRRSRHTLLALSAAVLAVGGILAVVYWPKQPIPSEEVRGDPKPAANLPLDTRNLPTGAVERLGSARGKGLPGRQEVITAAYSADGKTIIAADWTGAANMKGYQLWDAETGVPKGEVPTPIRALYGVSLSNDGRKYAWGGNEGVGVMGVSDSATGNALWRAKGGHQVAFTPDGRHVISSGYGATTVVADAATGNVIHTLSDPERYANSFVMSRDGSTVVTSTEKVRKQNYDSNEAKVEVWDVATGKLRKVVAARPYTFGFRQALAVSSDGKTVAFTENKFLTAADADTGAERWKIENPGSNHVWEFVTISPDGTELLGIRTNYDTSTTTTYDLFDMKTGRVIRSLEGEAYQFGKAEYSPDGRRIITFGEGVPVRIWDAATGRILPAYDGHRSAPFALAASDDGKAILSADRYAVCAWNVPALGRRFDLRYARSIGISGDGKTAVVTTGSETSTLLIDLTTNTRRVLEQHRTQYSAISRDGKRVAMSRFGDLIDIIDPASGKVLQSLFGQAGDLYALAFTPDGKRLLTAAKTRPRGPTPTLDGKGGPNEPTHDDALRVWDAETGKELRVWKVTAGSAALTPDGRTMIAGCADGRIRRFDVGADRELPPLKLHTGSVNAVAASPNGRTIASADSDAIILWDLATGRERKRFTPDHGATAALAFTADGRRLVSTGPDGTILIWDAGIGE
jgi:WD40 repeat protein